MKELKSTALAVCTTLVLLVGSGCSDSHSQETKSTTPTATADRTDPAATAAAILQAYQDKNLNRLAELCTPGNQELISEMAAQGDKHPRYKSIFTGDRFRAVEMWDGKVGDVRFRRGGSAVVKFGERNDRVFVVTLEKVGGKWCFEDVNCPSRDSFQQLPTKSS